jgi:ribosomal protein S18 acetylase RimI-like enzyme
MLAVDPRFTGQGVAQRLVETSLQMAQSRGYRCAVTEATGLISQRVFRKLGFEERFRVSYAEYKYEGRAVFASIVAHGGTALMEKAALKF